MALEGIKIYLKETFVEPLLNDKELEQLSWCLKSPPTPEKTIVASNSDYIEIRRCASRLHCLELLLKGEATYETFIQNQDKIDPYKPVLTKEQYQVLCQRFQAYDDLKKDALRVSTIISSVTLSLNAKDAADGLLGQGKYSKDSVEFLADTFDDIVKARKIYPLVDALFQKYPKHDNQEKPDNQQKPDHQEKLDNHQRLTAYLQAAFSHRSHFRHMLYTEGNANMFLMLIDKIKSKTLSKEAFDFWEDHWLINITGFRGHESDPKGSRYLTGNTFKAIQSLEESLALLFTNKIKEESIASQMLDKYLEKRAAFLELDKQSIQLSPLERHLLAHIGAMMRLFHPHEGEILAAGYFLIQSQMKKLSEIYFDNTDKSELTPTYAPALFQNAIDQRLKIYADDSVLQKAPLFPSKIIQVKAEELKRFFALADVIVACLPIYLQTLKEGKEKRINSTLSAEIPLCFRELAGKEMIMQLCGNSPITERFDILKLVEINVNSEGMANVIKKIKTEDIFESTQEGIAITPAFNLQTEQQNPNLNPNSNSNPNPSPTLTPTTLKPTVPF